LDWLPCCYGFHSAGIDFGDLWAVLRKANYWWLLPAIAFSFLSFFIRARRWILLIEPLGSTPGLMNTYHAVVTGYFANMIFPRLGEVAKCAALGKKENIPFDRLVGTMLVERTVDILSVLVILGVPCLPEPRPREASSRKTCWPAERKLSSSLGSGTFITIIVLLLAITAVVMFYMLRSRLSANPLFHKIYSFSDGLLAGLKSIIRLRRKWEFLIHDLLLWVSYFFMSYGSPALS
jgi:glycosyltransferase 2 family protein